MSNKRRYTCKRRRPHSCAGEGHNGAIGRSRWLKLSRRKLRRAEKRMPDIEVQHRTSLLRRYQAPGRPHEENEEQGMRYVQIEFYYYCPDPHEWLAGSESSIKCVEADKAVEKAMTDLGIEWRHAYTFPDGSLYKYARTELSDTDLECAINTALTGTGINVNHIYAYTDTDPDEYKPGKSKVCALKERFDEAL